MERMQGDAKFEDREAQGAGRVKSAPGIRLTQDQVVLLSQAFPIEETILVKQEFRSGYSGAVVLLVSVGVGRAPLVVKMAHPHDLQREYEAYEEYVRQVSPQNIAHLQGEPLVAADGQLGLLQYTFAGGESHLPTTSLHTYFRTAGAEGTSAVLNRIFRVYGRHWWANNRAQTYVLDEHYDRLLPVHLQAEQIDDEQTPDHVLKSGDSSILAVEQIEVGQSVQLIGYEVTKARGDGRRLTLKGRSPSSEASAPVRVRVESSSPSPWRPGDIVDAITVRITATRTGLLGAAASAALPVFDPEAEQFALSTRADGDVVLPNPLFRLQQQLYQVVETKMSIIHGDLNLQNILVDGPTGFAWLIDFAETRVGPTLLDLQRIEVQAITKLLPAGGDVPLGAVVEMMTRLHADPPLPAPPHPALREPYALMVTIRRLARQYLIDDLDWNEYYYGLVVALVGALKYDELDANARRLALVCAAAAESLVGMPLNQAGIEPAQPGPSPAVVTGETEAPAPKTPQKVPERQPVVAPTPPLQQVRMAGGTKTAAAVSRPAPQTNAAAPAKAERGNSRRAAGIAIAAVAALVILVGAWWIVGRSAATEAPASANAAALATTEAAGAAEVTQEAGGRGDEMPVAAAVTTSSTAAGPSATADSQGSAGAATATPNVVAGEGQENATEEASAGDAGETATPEEATATAALATETPVARPAEEEATLVLLARVNLRSGPGEEYPVVSSLAAGSVVRPVARSSSLVGDWFQIADPEGGESPVWISGDLDLVAPEGTAYLPVVTPAAPAPTPERQAAPAPAASTRSGSIYYSATDSSGVDNIYQVAATGDDTPTLVVRNGRQPAHKADGSGMAYTSALDSALGVAGYLGPGRNPEQYSSSPEDALPSWNPAGDRLIYTSSREGDRDWRLYVTWPQSGGASYQLGRGADPSWHPSQDRIVFRGCDDFGARCGLWTMATGGTTREPLTDNPSDSRPRWTPDGEAVVFMSSERDGNWELYRVAATGGEIVRLTNDPANDGLPAVSPDGSYVAFLSSRNGSWGIWAMPIDGGPAELVTLLEAPLPNWLAQGLSWIP